MPTIITPNTFSAKGFGYSNDLAFNFSPPSRMGTTGQYIMTGIASNPSGLFVAVGWEIGPYPAYSYSYDGITWSQPARMNSTSTTGIITGVSWSPVNNTFVAVGYNNTGIKYAISAYGDGLTFTTPAAMNANTSFGCQMTAVASNSNGFLVSVGWEQLTANSSYSTSSDGINWTNPVRMNNSIIKFMPTSIAANSNGFFISTGFLATSNGSSQGNPYYSSSANGLFWATPTQHPTIGNANFGSKIACNALGTFTSLWRSSFLGLQYSATSNATSWTTAGTIDATYAHVILGVCANPKNNSFGAVGVNNLIPNQAIWIKAKGNGTSWGKIYYVTGSTSLYNDGGLAVNANGKFCYVSTGQSSYQPQSGSS